MAQQKHVPQLIKTENLSLKAFLYTAPSAALLVLLINKLFLHHDSLAIVGNPSMAIFVSLLSGILALVLFVIFYIRGPSHDMQEAGIVKPRPLIRTLDAIALGIVYTVIVVGLTIVAEAVIANAFKGLRLDIYTSSLLIGISVGIAAYFIVKLVSNITTKQIMNVLSFFLIGGVFFSMITATDPLWWMSNFSSLGQASERYTLSFYVFNLTLIMSGYVIIILARHLYYDMKQLIEAHPKAANDRIDLVKIAFIVIALGLTGVGLFPYKPDALQGDLHVASAGFMLISFATLMIALRWILPNISRPFLAVTYIAAAGIAAMAIVYRLTDYLNVTAFELLGFVICFAWLYLFTQQIVYQRSETPKNHKQSKEKDSKRN